MLSRLGVSEPFGKTKVNHIDIVLLLTNANQEVVRLDVSVKEVATVDKLNSLEHLVSKHEYSLEGKLAFTVVKQVFK